MLNGEIGSYLDLDGRQCLLTRRDVRAHAIYGPYQHLEPGRYVVEFDIALATLDFAEATGDPVCGIADVVAENGLRTIVSEEIPLSRLRQGANPIRLAFTVERPQYFEYRFLTNGTVPLLAADNPRLVKVEESDDVEQKLLRARFPEVNVAERPPFFLHHLQALRHLHGRGFAIDVRGHDVVLSHAGLSFYAREPDDLRFIEEIFFRSAYNLKLPGDTCMIDIGMNIGIVSLLFASQDAVKEVHSYEPFEETYDRAIANLSLNPSLATKITAYNYALADRDEDITVLIGAHGDSGRNSIRGDGEGSPRTIAVKSAVAVLEPVIAAAKAKGRDIVAKIDCEGAEFPIFESLAAAGMLKDFAGFMVEWHRVFENRTQHDLIAPLLRNGFTVFDVSPPTGNGFFYASRSRVAQADA